MQEDARRQGYPNAKSRLVGGSCEGMFRQRPTLPPRLQGSTIGAGGLNFRVRNGTGCIPSAIATETVSKREPISTLMNSIASASIVSQVLGLLVPVGSTRCRAY